MPIPKDERAVADAIAKLIGAWDEAVYKKHIARAFPERDQVADFYQGLRAKYGTCAVTSAEHAAFERTILLACERGGELRLSLTLDDQDRAVIRSYKLRPAPAAGICPLR